MTGLSTNFVHGPVAIRGRSSQPFVHAAIDVATAGAGAAVVAVTLQPGSEILMCFVHSGHKARCCKCYSSYSNRSIEKHTSRAFGDHEFSERGREVVNPTTDGLASPAQSWIDDARLIRGAHALYKVHYRPRTVVALKGLREVALLVCGVALAALRQLVPPVTRSCQSYKFCKQLV